MTVLSIHKAKTTLSKLIARAEAGEEIIIARGKVPVVRLQPIIKPKRRPRFGTLKGKLNIPDSFFFVPLSEGELRRWEGNGDCFR